MDTEPTISPDLNHTGLGRKGGFTLVEAVMVIAITGIIAAMVAVFIRKPVEGYFDAARRVELTDIADTAVRRIASDLHLALPNSVRIAGPTCMEFLPTITGGRYRAERSCIGGACTGRALLFNTPVTDFDFLGGLNPVPASGDIVVVYNLGIQGADAYNNDNTAVIGTVTANNIQLAATATGQPVFQFASPGNRFHVIPASERAVSYVCAGAGVDSAGNGTGILFRRSGYVPASSAPTTCPIPPAGTPILATRVSSCNFTYAAGVTARSGLASIRIGIAENNETVNLYQEVHVNNAP